MTEARIDFKIGELLVAAEILTESDLVEAIKSAQQNGLPVGRVLIMAGFCSEAEFQAALAAQSLVRDAIVPPEMAISALQLIASHPITFEDALRELGWEPKEDQESNKLGELLLLADIVPQMHLDTAMKTSQTTSLPLGRLLVSLGILSDEVLATALNAQLLIRSGRISREQAINGLRSSYQRRKPFEATLNEQGFYKGPYRPSIRLGELLVSAEIINREQMQAGLEESLRQEKSVGQVLVESRLVSKHFLNQALTLQEMVSNETITPAQAIAVLNTLSTTKKTMEEALANLKVPDGELKTNVRFYELMRIAGVIKQADAERLGIGADSAPGSESAARAGMVLLQNEIVDKRTLLGALRCYYLICTGWLNMQKAIIALNNFFHKSCSFDEVLRELNWTVRTNFKEAED